MSEDGTGLKIMEGECTFPEMSETHHRLFSDSLLPNMVITSRGCICISYKTCYRYDGNRLPERRHDGITAVEQCIVVEKIL